MEGADLDKLEAQLEKQQFLDGALPGAQDRETYDKLKAAHPSPSTHPNTFAWFALVHKFTDAVRATWGADKKKEAPKKEEPKK